MSWALRTLATALGAALLVSAPAAAQQPHGGQTRCDACHTTAGWSGVRFDHARTGFRLRGRHEGLACKACHTSGDLAATLPTDCASCHRDAHGGDLGQRCASCHDEQNWKSRFSAEAHRATGFPLTGRHAVLPCEECHRDVRDRAFTRGSVQCLSCHAKDLPRAAAHGVDHAASGFSTNCRECHGYFDWRRARFPAHDQCFELSGGPHFGIRCESCHTAVPQPAVMGSCNSNNAACTRCHTHNPTATARIHRQVPGYAYQDRRCYECHLFTQSGHRPSPVR
jgi:hypothetical protein